MNRLKELARRQEALAEKMKELQNQIAQAKTDEEKEELDNQLKRLQEEQEQLLRDVDDLKEKMETSENQATMAEVVAAKAMKTVNLAKPVPVLLLYWTAQPTPDGQVLFRNDIYGRDPPTLAALNSDFTLPR